LPLHPLALARQVTTERGAQTAVERLIDRGVPAADISLIAQKERIVEPAVVEAAPNTANGLTDQFADRPALLQ
jgi:hypothetical protein